MSTSTSTSTPTSPASWSRLVRFRPTSDPTSIAIGEPVSSSQDVGLALYNKENVRVHVYSGTSVLDAGARTGREEEVSSVLSPLGREEVGTIRCIGLNYESHAIECNLAIPQVPIVFHKPATALADPWPAPTVIPKHTVGDDSADYEAELVVVIGKDAKNVKEEDALDYVLGYTAANDVSSRVSQFAQSQWNYSKSFDSACPVGPVLVHRSQVGQVADIKIKGELSGGVVQDGGLDDLIFSVPKLIAFMSQGTTLPAGTIILTGTPPGIGWAKEPRRMLKHGDEFRVHVSHGVGTLINGIEFEK